ncbi:MAG: DNA-3-methyladenine glycosylase I [Cytophagaceae bacterium]|nr:DNA-3-methyladenine glycosylase I [Cytophagaceae bacterium]
MLISAPNSGASGVAVNPLYMAYHDEKWGRESYQRRQNV